MENENMIFDQNLSLEELKEIAGGMDEDVERNGLAILIRLLKRKKIRIHIFL